MALRVFEMNDCEWWVADCSAEKLLAAYMKETGVTREGALGDDDPKALPRKLTDAELDRLVYNDADGTRRTFREELAREAATGGAFPRIFATTEC